MKLTRVILLSCLLAAGGGAQSQHETQEAEVVATVGPRTILARDVLERIELMPWPGKDRPSMHDSVAMQATLSLVAEKLLSLQASALGIGLDEENAARFASLERALARDALYREEIAGRVKITAQESAVALKRFAVRLRLAVFASGDEVKARQLAEEMNRRAQGENTGRSVRPSAGRDKDARAPTNPEEHPRDAGATTRGGADTVSISFGELVRAHEDVAYALTRRLEARVSFTASSGWLVLQLLDRRTNPAFASLSVEDRATTAESLLRKRKQTELASAYCDRLAAGIPSRMDSVLFNAIADTLLSAMRRDVTGHRKGKAFGVLEQDVIRLWRVFRAERGRPFIVHGRDTVTVGQMIDAMAFHPIQTRSLGTGIFKEDLNRAMITVAESELVSDNAMRLHYNGHPDVRRDLETWTEAWQTQELARRILDSATLSRPTDYQQSEQPGGRATGGSRRSRDGATTSDPLNAYIARLAAEQQVSIDYARVRQLQYTPVNMVTRRLIGFGGTLPAVPLLPHFWDWFRVWQMKQRVQP